MSKVTDILKNCLQYRDVLKKDYLSLEEAEQAIEAYYNQKFQAAIGEDKEQILPHQAANDDGEAHDRFFRTGGYNFRGQQARKKWSNQ